MQPVPHPIREGETLGAYFYWAQALDGALMQCNAYQQAEQDFYRD